MENLTKPAKKSSVKKHAHDGDKKGKRPKAAEPLNSEERVERQKQKEKRKKRKEKKKMQKSKKRGSRKNEKKIGRKR